MNDNCRLTTRLMPTAVASTLITAFCPAAASSQDVQIRPAEGGSVVIEDEDGTQRLRVQDSGEVFIPGLGDTGQNDDPLCFESGSGQPRQRTAGKLPCEQHEQPA